MLRREFLKRQAENQLIKVLAFGEHHPAQASLKLKTQLFVQADRGFVEQRHSGRLTLREAYGRGRQGEAWLMVKFRNLAVHLYAEVTPAQVLSVISKHLGDFRSFAQDIVAYLDRQPPDEV